MKKNTSRDSEKFSSCISLSDMEIFIFPEIMFALVVSNIMSPIIWSWKDDPWFEGIEKMGTNKKIQRIKQYIMKNYDFNLDLDTWGLTTKERELERFSDFVDMDTLKQSNALFGYEGDKYYFDLEIRKHFGLDKYKSEVIPYWKTETIETMSNFYRKNGYSKGAGECVSFSTLYYAAMHILGEIPLEDMYMIATPLHSQGYIDIGDGIITNNRRIVTKNMWFNGTEISMKARRALDNEKITFVANNTGYVHRIYNEATMPENIFKKFQGKIEAFLETNIDYQSMTSFLRNATFRQVCFQFEHERFGKKLYIEAEKVFPYEHGSPYLIGNRTQTKLLDEVDSEEFYQEPIDGRVNLKRLEEILKNGKYTVDQIIEKPQILEGIHLNICSKISGVLKEVVQFCKTRAQMPEAEERKWVKEKAVDFKGLKSRDEVLQYVYSNWEDNETLKLAIAAYRDVETLGNDFFMKAALERNPVSNKYFENDDLEVAFKKLIDMENISIYSENRLAQPDEVINFKCGDGIEKAIVLLNLAASRGFLGEINSKKGLSNVLVNVLGREFIFETSKDMDFKYEVKNEKS